MAQLKLSNVIGAPFRPFVREQLVARVVHSLTGGGLLPGGNNNNRGDDLLRTSEEVLNLANQLAWVKLSSSVRVTDDYLNYLKNQFASSGDEDAFLQDWTARGLARNWILQGGTSKDIATQEFATALFNQGVLGDVSGVANFQGRRTQTQLREGIGYDGAYGLGGFRAQGYRPMPGITSAKIQSAGRLGSLRYATITFKVWNRNQLDIIDTLYLRLGYTMLLEWGHTQYFERDTSTTLIRDNYGIDNFFLSDSKEDILYSINRNVIDSNGNYDGMLGLVTNFDCSFNQEGGWDCSIKLIGLGSIMESQKINLAYTMPPGVQKAWNRIREKYEQQLRAEADKKRDEQNRLARQVYGNQVGKAQANWDSQHPIRSLKTLAESIGTHKKVAIGTDAELKGILQQAKISTIAGSLLASEFYYFSNPTPTPTDVNALEEVLYKGQTPPTTDPTTTTLPTLLPIKAGTLFTYDFGPLNASAAAGGLGVQLPNDIAPLLPGTIRNQQLSNRLNNYKNIKEYKAIGVGPIIDKLIGASGITQTVFIGLLDTRPLLVGGGDGLQFTNTRNYAAVSPSSRVPGLLTTVAGVGTVINLDDIRQNRPSTFFQITRANGQVYRTKLSITATTTQTQKDLPFVELGVSSGYKSNDNYYANIKATELVTLLDKILTANSIQFKVEDQGGITYVTETVGGTAYTKAIVRARGVSYVDDVTLYTDPSWIDRFKNVVDFTTLIQAFERIGRTQSSKSLTVALGFQFELETEILTPITVLGQEEARPTFGSLGGPALVSSDYSQVEINMANMSLGLGSALEAILTIIKYQTIVDSDKQKGPVVTVDHTNLTGQFLNYGSGSLPTMAPLFKRSGNDYVLNIDGSKPLESKDAYPFLSNLQGEELLKDPTSLGVKGYATALLQDYNRQPANNNNTTTAPSTPQQRWEQIPAVDFQGMMKSYLIKKHILSSAQDKPNYKNEYPVYIKLSYLLFFINNQSLLYDTTRKSKVSPGVNLARPIFYIDYNNRTNLCSTTPTQLSIDPEVGMIPFKGGINDYKKLFIDNVTPTKPYFLEGSNKDVISNSPKFGSSWFRGDYDNQGKTMDILLNVDYLLGVIKATVDRDNHNNVYLQAFLERIVADLNKAFGDINAFRVAYNDAGNVVQILDDQYTPALKNEDPSLFQLRNELLSKRELFTIPVFEEASLARSFTLQSDTSTKMSRAIAIGAQAANSGSVQSTDASSYHWLNNGLTDRFITVKENATKPTTQAVTATTTPTGNKTAGNSSKSKAKTKATAKAVSTPDEDDPNRILATKFNAHVINIYSTGDSIYRENVDSSRNFLVQGTTKAKAEDEKSYGSLTIPYNASLTILGISGIMMGNAFLLPDKILPLSIRGTNKEARFGFFVMGLDHSLDNNEWTTSIKGQIVRIREEKKSAGNASPVAAGTTTAPTVVRNTRGLETTFIASNSGDAADARVAVETYFGKPITDEEWNEMVALIFAEAGTTPEQKAYVTAAILNIANKQKESITDSIRVAKRYEPVTGTDGKTSTKAFIQGPPPASEAQIYEAIIKLLPGVSKKINAFTAINPQNYKGSKKGLAWRAKLIGYANRGKGLILYNKNDKSNGTIFAEL